MGLENFIFLIIENDMSGLEDQITEECVTHVIGKMIYSNMIHKAICKLKPFVLKVLMGLIFVLNSINFFFFL